MLDTILQYVHPGKKLSIVDWLRYTNVILLRSSVYETRFLDGSFCNSPIVNFLESLLHHVDLTDILKIKSDFVKYTKVIAPLVDQFQTAYDLTANAKELAPLFVSKESKIQEIFLNVSCKNPMSSLPLDEPWDHWTGIKPVRIVHHDANELVTDLFRFMITFKGENPTYLVASIDLAKLFLKYVKYYEHCNEYGVPFRMDLFLQHHIFPCWFADLRRIWLFNILRTQLKEPLNFSSLKCDETIAPLSALQSGLPDVYRIQKQFHQKHILLDDFLSTEWFDIRSSMYSWIEELHNDFQMPYLQQYSYLRFFLEFPIVKYVLELNSIIGTDPVRKLNRDILYQLRRYNDQNIYLNAQNPVLRQRLKVEMNDLFQVAKY